VFCRAKIGIDYFVCPARGCYACVAICLAVGCPPDVVYLRSTRDLVWRLSACFRMGHHVVSYLLIKVAQLC
jgi:hypothetical protein